MTPSAKESVVEERRGSEIALALTAITKRFGTVRALDAATLTVRRGTVHALLGENGAGKTTLMRVAFGMVPPDAGTITIDGTDRHFRAPAESIAAGIGMVHQHFMLVPAMTVAENVALGGTGRYDERRTAEEIRTISGQYGLQIDPAAIVRTLSVGAQQRVEIVKALMRNARVLILDEPTAVLPPAEARQLLKTARGIVDKGGSIVLITHKLRDALEFADDITVLRHGKTVYAAHTTDSGEQQLAAAMLGTTDRAPKHDTPLHRASSRRVEPPTLALSNVTVRDAREMVRIHDATVQVHAGEILGIAAVEGNGEHELIRVLAGRLAPDSGTTTLPPVIGFVPEDRHRDALILDFPLYENLALASAGARRGLIDWSAERAHATLLMKHYDVRASTEGVPARTLSGGNQQKLVLARELDAAPSALVVENPTRGLDIRATTDVHARLRAARDRGAAVAIYSSDLDEVLSLADRVVVVANGRVLHVSNDRTTIGNAMIAGARTE
jgi:ABC-type uncharacterized transport system ATPase subunit